MPVFLFCRGGGGIDDVRIGDVSRMESLLACLSFLLSRLGGGGIEFDRGGGFINSDRGGGGGNDSSSL